MRKLTDVYIKVTKQNQEELSKITCVGNLPIGEYLIYYDDVLSSFEFENENGVDGLKKVSLSQLKRLIDTIPTREEITRLKRQISAYKTNYDRAVKHSLSKEDVIEELQRKLNRERSTITDLFKQRKEVQLNHCKQIRTLAQEVERVKSLYDDVLKENEQLKNINSTLKQTNYYLYDKKDTLLKENKQLKQRKWWQIWKI